jgi:hypothetical protein
MTTPPEQPDPKRPAGPDESLPGPLEADLRRALRPDEVDLPSRVDERVLSASAEHFASFGSAKQQAEKPDRELKPGVLAWITGRPLTSAGIGGALLAASLAIALIVGAPNSTGPSSGRSVAMDQALPDEEASPPSPPASLGAEIASKPAGSMEAPAMPEPSALARRSGARDDVAEAESADAILTDAAPEQLKLTELPGDLDADGEITIADALLLARALERGETPSVAGLDLVADGRLDRADADAIARLAVRLTPPSTDTPNTEGAS